MSENIQAKNLIEQRVIADIQGRIDIYFKYLRGATKEEWDHAQAARDKISDWAVSDLLLLLGERTTLISELNDLKNFISTIQSRPNCNDCGDYKECEYRPAWGSPVVYGCPLWKNEQ